eukprot:Gb_29443 [translate_table: standard]
MNSLHNNGHCIPASLMACKFSKLPWKYLESVKTLRHAAPPFS